MKTLVVATDFSEAAKNAARYGIELARALNYERVVLYHSFEIQPIATQMPAFDTTALAAIDEANIERLTEMRTQFEKEYQGLANVEVVTDQYPLVAGIERQFSTEGGIVVAGVTGKNRFEQVVIGNSALSLARHCKYPVLLVPAGTKYKPINHILYACHPEKLNNSSAARAVNNISSLNNAKIEVLYVNTGSNGNDSQVQQWNQQLANAFPQRNAGVQVVNHNNIAAGILGYAREHNVDIIVAFIRHYGFWESLFHKSTTTTLANQVRRPLLLVKSAEYTNA